MDWRYCLHLPGEVMMKATLIAQMILDLHIAVNIIHADLRSIEGDTFGELVVQVADVMESARVMRYLEDRGISVEEVSQDA